MTHGQYIINMVLSDFYLQIHVMTYQLIKLKKKIDYHFAPEYIY